MGNTCSAKKKPSKSLQIPQIQNIPHVANSTQTQAATQSYLSQNLDDLSATLRSTSFKIPVFKQDIRTIYKFEKTIGYGTFGKVYLAHKLDVDLPNLTTSLEAPKHYAIKVMRDINKNERIFKIANREISIMRILDHPNIVKLHEIYEDERHLSLVLEYCSGGELLDYLLERHHLSEPEAAHYMHDILISIEYLHSNHISHRDLKLQNFMFDRKGNDSILKLIDFGLSAQLTPEETTFKTIVGSPLYVAPEVISKKPYDSSCDIWSLGVICYLLLCGEPPFKGSSNFEIFKNICEGVYKFNDDLWKDISIEAQDLIKGLLKVDPKQRMSINQALNHAWFHKMLDNGSKIESPIRNVEMHNVSLLAFKGTDNNVFKAFDKDSNSHSFSLDNSENESKEAGCRNGKLKKLSIFNKKKEDEVKMDLDILNESKPVKLEHFLC